MFFSTKAQDFNVLHYGITLNVDNITKEHNGYTDISLTSSAISIELMLKNHSVDSIVDMNTHNALEYTYDNLRINIVLPIQSTDNYNIRVYYHGGEVVENNSTAWGGIHYETNMVYTMGVAFADYPHSYARSWFAVHETFTDKATYNINIRTRNNVKPVCSGVLDSISTENDYHTFHYSLSQQTAPYLVAITIADFYEYTDTIHSQTYNYDLPLSVHYINPNQREVIENMFSNISLAFDTLEKSFGRFAFNRIGYCVTPLGSMEHVDNISLASGVLTGDMDGMSNIVHELGHSWFGNNITCSEEKDMWLNEGWTTFTTRLSLSAIYGEKQCRDFFRNSHEKVLSKVVMNEGYFPVNQPDSTQTYSSTVYDKGALITISLKEYLGDDLFYEAVREMINTYQFSNVSSQIVKDFLSQYTGKDLTPFFNSMVYSSSTPHYSIAEKSFNNNSATLKICQRAYPDNTKTLSYSRMPVTFFDENYNEYKTFFEFSGTESEVVFDNLPFSPVNAMLDYDEEFMDLTTDYAQMIESKDTTYQFPNTYFRLHTNDIQDSMLVRCTLHWIGAEEEEDLPYGVKCLSQQHYWSIEGVNMDSHNIQGLFRYEVSSVPNAFDTTLAKDYTQRDSLILLYRPTSNSPWTLMPFTPVSSSKGYMKSDMLFEGDYIMALGDRQAVGLNSSMDNDEQRVRVYPNPAENMITIECFRNQKAVLYSINGKMLKEYSLNKGMNKINLGKYKEKSFIINFLDDKNKAYLSKIVIKK